MPPFRRLARLASATALALGLTQPGLAAAQEQPIRTTFVRHASAVLGLLYEPATPGPRAKIGVLVTHGGDYLAFPACSELAKRGYRVLCEYPSGDDFDRTLKETGMAMTWLKQVPGVEKTVLLGHSGGATIVTAYQAIAENGIAFCQAAEKIHKCPDNLAGLPKADGVVLPDANIGNAAMMLFSIDPAVTDETTGMKTDPALDMFNPANGYRKGGTAYSPEFTRRFFAAEAARYNRLVGYAEQRLALIEAGKGRYSDDEPLDIPGASSLGPNNKLYSQDTRLLSSSREAWPLFHKDGSTSTGIVHSVRVAEPVEPKTASFGFAAMKTTVRKFLSGSAIRVDPDFHYDEHAVHGVHWTSTYASPPGNVEQVSVPLLTLGMTGHWEGLAAEEIYNHAKSADKSIGFIEGASHMLDTCKACETTPGQFGDTTKTTFDAIDAWLSKAGRFLP
ncbi:alpha/beta hydrolase [Novosphingobium flavum]|uniref:Alpha/beta hydrolase n=1 Tax=Novosphingobium flavum TaxID=1778672 RepID=A0A7X1FQQ1_9SPHN|nr:alpha/beta hydrolase [Novosphingobium flavum]